MFLLRGCEIIDYSSYNDWYYIFERIVYVRKKIIDFPANINKPKATKILRSFKDHLTDWLRAETRVVSG